MGEGPMKKRWITLLAVVLLAIGLSLSATVILAGRGDSGLFDTDKLSVRVAALLGLDETVVDDAIKQARRELWDEGLQAKLSIYEAKLTAMVKEGELTQEQADEKLAAFQSQTSDASAFKKKLATKTEGLQTKLGIYDAKLTAMVEEGVLTQEQADEKLKESLLKSKGATVLKKVASKDESLQEKFTAMVEKGALTQEQADEKLRWILAGKTKAKSS